MTQDARQAAEATDYAAKARELALSLCGGDEDEHAPCIRGLGPEGKCSCVRFILFALQSAHAAGDAKGDAAAAEALRVAREALQDAAETLQFAGEKLGLPGPGDGKDRKADADDDAGIFPTLRAVAKALAALDSIAKGGV